MRFPPEHKAQVRAELVEAASRRVRTDGPSGLTVADVMADTGRTVGGFYKHFDSKDALVGEALAVAMRTAADRLLHAVGPDLTGAAFEQRLVRVYLSRTHLRDVAGGCPLVAGVTEVSRLDDAVRAPLVHEVERLIDRVAARLDPPSRARAWHLMTSCMGALTLARALPEPAALAMLREVRASWTPLP